MDLFDNTQKKARNALKANSYSAKDIEVLEGLEPVRKRPGMYIGGTDEKALYHLISEVLDNSMDEAVAGFASVIKVHLNNKNIVTIEDNGRGIPVDPHPKFKDKSALEVILTTLHSGGKFTDNVYSTSGGLHGVGVSVVNALSDLLVVEIRRSGKKYSQKYSKGLPISELEELGKSRDNGTKISFHPDQTIFPNNTYDPEQIYKILCSKAYLFKGVTIEWSCDKSFIDKGSTCPLTETIHFPNGLKDYINSVVNKGSLLTPELFAGDVDLPDQMGRVEWVLSWVNCDDVFLTTYCNTIHTQYGGTHEAGFKNAIIKGLKNYAELSDKKRATIITSEDCQATSCSILSLFIKNPSFQGQTKEKLLNQEAVKYVENAVRHSFDHWLTSDPKTANVILDFVIEEAEDRLKRRKSKEVSRKNAIKSMRLPGKLADCASKDKIGSELFLVEGDSAGGSAKQARMREFQAILPLKGKILNVASNSMEKIKSNQEISDLIQALGVGIGDNYIEEDLRYEKVIIMTDADVDGAHITSLLLTFFFQQMPELIFKGHLYLAQPPLYKVTHSANSYYVRDDKEKATLIKQLEQKRGPIEISRFKGLGEMSAAQLKETTMNPEKRTLLKVMIDVSEKKSVSTLVDNLMGKNPELRFKFIQENTVLNKDKLDSLIDS